MPSRTQVCKPIRWFARRAGRSGELLVNKLLHAFIVHVALHWRDMLNVSRLATAVIFSASTDLV